MLTLPLGRKAYRKVHFCPSYQGPYRPMPSRLLEPNQVIKPRNLAHMLLRLVSPHFDTFLANIDNLFSPWSGGPEIVAAHDDFGPIDA